MLQSMSQFSINKNCKFNQTFATGAPLYKGVICLEATLNLRRSVNLRQFNKL